MWKKQYVPVDDVASSDDGEIATNGTGLRHKRVGLSEHLAAGGDDLGAL